MTNEEVYHVKVTGPGLALEKDVAREIGDQIVVLILTGGVPSGSSARGSTTHAANNDGQHTDNKVSSSDEARVPKSIREFLIEHTPKRNPDKIAAIGYYLQVNQGQETFTKNDIRGMFTQAAEPVPTNLSRDINWTIRAGWIAEHPDQPGTYYITNPGRKVVEANFPKEEIKKTPHPQKPRRRSKSKGDNN